MKKNDYIIASINNPDFTALDFKNIAGFSLKDTQFLSEEDYLSNDFVKNNPLFLDSNGIFLKNKFKEFYNKKALEFGEFSNEDFADNYAYSVFDVTRPASKPVRGFGIAVMNTPNPTMQSIGIEGVNILGQRTLSDREIAQSQKIFDYSSGKFSNESPNDSALFSNPFKWLKYIVTDPLVLATYDENGTHIDPITGRLVLHGKGLVKLNTNGLPYYETLGGRSLIGKEILSSTDILTIDGSTLNKYDFLDSDDLDKSISGVIVKTATSLLPLLSTTIAPYYGTYLVLRELMKTAPMLYGMSTALFNDKPDALVPNYIAAYANKLTTSTSDYSKEHMFSFENLGNLVSDIALQWEQLAAVIRHFNKLNKATNSRLKAVEAKAFADYTKESEQILKEAMTGKVGIARAKQLTGASNIKELKELSKGEGWKYTIYGDAALTKHREEITKLISSRTLLGQDISLGYMALISNTDVYLDALEHGTSKEEAAALAIMSTAGMFTVDKYLGLGEMFFQEPEERVLFRKSIKEEVKNIMKAFDGVKDPEKGTIKGLGKYFKAGADLGKKTVTKFYEGAKDRTLPLVGKAIGEGLEEMSEELVTDLVKSAGELAAKLGYIKGPEDLGAWDSGMERYAMSALGGFLGGGIYGLKNLGVQQQLAYKSIELLVRLGKTAEIRKELNKLYDEGLLGSTDLSIQYTGKDKNSGTFITADEKNKSQNDYVYDLINQGITQLEQIIGDNRLQLSEEDLFKMLVMKDENYMRLKDYLLDKSYITGFLERYQDLVEAVARKSAEIEALSDKDKGKLQSLLLDLNLKLLERDKFFNGEVSFPYLRKLTFALNPTLTKGFLPISNIEDFAKAELGVPFSALDPGQQATIAMKYNLYMSSPYAVKKDLDEAFTAFDNLTRKVAQPLSEKMQLTQLLVNAWSDAVKNLEDTKKVGAWSWETQLEGESDDSYALKDTLLEGETYALFIARIASRQAAINQHNENLYRWLQAALANGGAIEETTRRRLKVLLDENAIQIKRNIISQFIRDPELGTMIIEGKDPIEALAQMEDTKREELRKQILLRFDFVQDKSPLFESTYGFDDALVMLYFSKILQQLVNDLNIENITIDDLYKKFEDSPDLELSITEAVKQATNEVLQTNPEFDVLWILPDQVVDSYPAVKKLIAYADGLKAINPNLSEEERKSAVSDLQQRYSLLDIREGVIDSEISNAITEWKTTGIEKLAKEVAKALETDKTLELIKQLEDRASIDSPARQVLELVASNLGDESVNIEKLLADLGSRWDNLLEEGEFELTDVEIEQLNKAKGLLEATKSVLASAYKDTFIGDSYSYNKAMNEFSRAHDLKDWEELPTIDKNFGNIINQNLDSYIEEIDEWIAASKRNADNKLRNLAETERALDHVLLQTFLTTLGENHKYLEGLPADASVATAASVFHHNVKKLLAQGATLDDIFDEIFSKVDADESLLTQRTSTINSNLSLADFTNYDKYTFLASLITVDYGEFLKALRDFFKKHSEVAPLPTQELGMLYTYALKTNREVIYRALDRLSQLAEDKGYQLPAVYGVVMTGIGGAGKTAAEASFAYDENETTWVSAPEETLTESLKAIAPKSIVKDKAQLLEFIKNGKSFSVIEGKGLDNTSSTVLPNVSDSLATSNAPAHLIIDEITHFSSEEIQLIGQWARKNGVRLTLLGDENLRGDASGFDGTENIARETLIAFRAPRLGISLRTGNLWKTEPQNALVRLMDLLRNSVGAETELNKTKVINALKTDFKLKYWESTNDINGDKVVKSLTSLDLDRLRDKKVVYIGTDPEDSIKNLPNVEILTLNLVQGKEFDYAIIDNPFSDISKDSGYSVLNALRDLYTVISRSRIGSILIDSTDELGKLLIVSKKLDYTTQSINLSDEAKKDLTAKKLDKIEALLKAIPEFEEVNTKKSNKSKENNKDGKDDIDDGGIDLEYDNTEPLAYSNIVFLGGIEREVKDFTIPGYIKGRITKWKATGKRKDIGIFASEGYIALNPEEKAKRVYDLHCLRSIFTYDKFGVDNLGEFLPSDVWTSLPESVRSLFSGTADFRDVEYYAVAEDKDEDEHSLIGYTTAENSKSSFMKGDDGKDKVVSVLARIKSKKDGTVYTITLGALANPSVWEANINKKQRPTKKEEAKAFDDNIKKQRKALKNYKEWLNTLVNKNLEVRINKPKFSGQTELIPLGENARLGDLANEISLWEKYTKNTKVSDVYVIVDDLLGINPKLSNKLKGRAVVFVSNDPNSNPETLLEEWKKQQLDRENNVAKVRMIVLNNEGVSFNSIYSGSYKELYSTSFNSDKDFSIPFNAEGMSIKMFTSLWNFRANLKTFNNAVDKFLDEQGWTREELDKHLETYRALYVQATKELTTNKNQRITEKLFADWLQAHPNKEVITIRNFNLNLLIKQFRLGYSKHGAFIGRLYGVSKDVYPNPKEANGIYILSTLALQYEGVIDKMFEVLVNPIFESAVAQLPTDQNLDYQADENWYKNMRANRVMSFGLENVVDDQFIKQVEVPNQEALESFTYALINTAKYIRKKSLVGETAFTKAYQTPGKDGKTKYRVKLNIDNEEQEVSYLDIEKALTYKGVSGLFPSSDEETPGLVGQLPINWEIDLENSTTKWVDTRMDTFYSLMFHGVVALTEYNDFDKSKQLIATDAIFPKGLFSDPILDAVPSTGKTGSYVVKTLTAKALFSANMIPGSPRFTISIEPYKGIVKNDAKAEKGIEKNELDKEAMQQYSDVTSIVGTELLPEGTEVTKAAVKAAVDEHNKNTLLTGIKRNIDPNKLVVFNNGKYISLTEKYDSFHLEAFDPSKTKRSGDIVRLVVPYNGVETTYTVVLQGDNIIVKNESTNNIDGSTINTYKEFKEALIAFLQTIKTDPEESEDWYFPESVELVTNAINSQKWNNRAISEKGLRILRDNVINETKQAEEAELLFNKAYEATVPKCLIS